MRSRRRIEHFPRVPGSPAPVLFEVRRRARFSEVDAMAIVWHGRYFSFFEEASAELGRKVGLSYQEYFNAGLRAPYVEFHLDYHQPLFLDEEFTVQALLVWHEGSRLNMEYRVLKQDGSLAASGYSVQLLTDGRTGEPCYVSPPLLVRCRERWRAGEFR